MKKILLVILFSCLVSSSASANVFIDMSFSYIHNWNNGNKGSEVKYEMDSFGFVWGFGYRLNNEFTVLQRNIVSVTEEDDLYMPDSKVKSTIYGSVIGIEFTPYFSILRENRIIWGISFGFGYAYAETEMSGMGFEEKMEDDGLTIELNTGFTIEVTQHLKPFITLGFSKVFYMDDFSESKNYGLSMICGIRYFLFGSKKLNNEF